MPGQMSSIRRLLETFPLRPILFEPGGELAHHEIEHPMTGFLIAANAHRQLELDEVRPLIVIEPNRNFVSLVLHSCVFFLQFASFGKPKALTKETERRSPSRALVENQPPFPLFNSMPSPENISQLASRAPGCGRARSLYSIECCDRTCGARTCRPGLDPET